MKPGVLKQLTILIAWLAAAAAAGFGHGLATISLAAEGDYCPGESTAEDLRFLLAQESSASPFSRVEPAHRARLPRQMVSAVRARTFGGLPEQSEGGKGVIFKIYGYDSDYQIKPMWMGESIQASFVAKVLREKFPFATFEGAGRHQEESHPGRRMVEIWIGDSAESGRRFGRRGPTSLEMAILKNANPGLASSAPFVRNLRSVLGIKDSDFVLSLYLKGANYLQWDFKHIVKITTPAERDANPSIKQIVAAASAAASNTGGAGGTGGSSPRIVFLSTGGTTVIKREELMDEVPAGYSVVLLSELEPQQFANTHRYFVVNDLEGRVPHVHAVSNLAVIAGPINSVEAVQVGAPTVIIANDKLREGYLASAYTTLNQTSASRGAVIASGTAELVNAMRAAPLKMNDPNQREPRKAVTDKTTSDFLDHLETVVAAAWAKSDESLRKSRR